MTKREQVKRYIQKHGFRSIHVVVLDCECSPSTIYAALRDLRDAGMLDERGQFVGRTFVKPAEVRAALEQIAGELGYVLVNKEVLATIRTQLFLRDDWTFWRSLEWAAPRAALESSIGYHGTLVKLLPQRAVV